MLLQWSSGGGLTCGVEVEYWSTTLCSYWPAGGVEVEYWGGGGIHLSPKRGRVREADAYHKVAMMMILRLEN